MKKSWLFIACLLVIACGDDGTPKAPNLALASLTVSSGTLTPPFDPVVTAYAVSVSNAVDQITVTGKVVDANNTVSCEPAQPAALTVGSNLVTVRVTSADGVLTNAYRVVVLRVVSDNANLASLAVSEGTLILAFDPAVTAYSVVYLSNSVAAATLTASAVHGEAVVSYPYGQTPSLSVGSNQLLVRVTAEDGTTTKDYDIRVYRMGADYTSATIGTLKYIPAGAFQRDGTNHDISYVSALRMSRTEITRAQYSARMGTDPADPTYSSGIGDPVQTVNWYHAIAFCNRLSLAEGLEPVYTVSGVDFNSLQHADVPLTNNSTWNVVSNNWLATGYRLPTEMEWMWAAMGAQMGSDPFTVNTTGYGKAFAGSTGSNAIGEYAWYGHYSSGSATAARTTVAGSKLPNELGLVDMSGNVWGLCHDWYGDYPAGYQADYRGAVSGTYRVNRGGSWYRIASSCAVAYRYYNFPSHREFGAGFRVVRP